MSLKPMIFAVLAISACGSSTSPNNPNVKYDAGGGSGVTFRDASTSTGGNQDAGVTDAGTALSEGVFEVTFSNFGTGCTGPTSDWQTCLQLAQTYCASKGFTGGTGGIVDYNENSAFVACFESEIISKKIANIPLNGVAPNSIRGRSLAFQQCDYPPPPITGPNAREPNSNGFGPIIEADGSFSTICINDPDVVKYRTWDNNLYPDLHNSVFTPCQLDSVSAPPTTLACTREISRICRLEGANYGYGPVNWGASKKLGYADFGVVCIYRPVPLAQ